MIGKLVSIKMIGGVATVGFLAAGVVTTHSTTNLTSSAPPSAMVAGTTTAVQTAVTSSAAATPSVNTAVASSTNTDFPATKAQVTSVQPMLAAPAPSLKSSGKLASFNNGKPADGATWFGATLGDGKRNGTGWPKTSDIQSMIDLGVRAIRLPILPQYCINADGTINTWVVTTLATDVKLANSKGVSVALDAHTYLPFTDPAIADFWAKFAPAIEKAIGGPSPLFGIELSNEPGKSSRDLALWTEPLRTTIRAIRAAGYQSYIFAGAGDWNNATFLPLALAEVQRTGGLTAMDPFDRLIFTMHDYWNKDADPAKTRNDQGLAVDGTISIKKRYDPALNAARQIGAKIVMSEIGGGISPKGPLPRFNGLGKDGKELEEEYFAYAKANRDVLIGSWFWMGGKAAVGYRHKIEAGNQHTRALQTGLWQ